MPIILCNAQPFGFGPSSILSSLFPWLKRLSSPAAGPLELHFVSARHSYDLHRSTSWDRVHLCDINGDEGPEALTKLCHTLKPMLFLTIVDPDAAAAAHQSGTTVVVVDPLFWYWREVPEALKDAHRVIAFDFFGVSERIERERLSNVLRVPPLFPTAQSHTEVEHSPIISPILINLGGLENPFASISDSVQYAKLVISAVDVARESISGTHQSHLTQSSTVILTSRSVSQVLGDDRVITASPEQSRKFLKDAQCAFLTPGYSNIFDAADLAHVVCFLPPASATQSRQLASIRDAGMVNYSLEWHEVLGTPRTDYWTTDDEGLSFVTTSVQRVMESNQARNSLQKLCQSALSKALQTPQDGDSGARSQTEQPLRALLKTFGKDDGTILAQTICEALPDLELDLT